VYITYVRSQNFFSNILNICTTINNTTANTISHNIRRATANIIVNNNSSSPTTSIINAIVTFISSMITTITLSTNTRTANTFAEVEKLK